MRKTIGLGTLVGFYLVTLMTFFKAYLHPSKKVLISVNNYGEAHIDFILILLTLPFVILFIYDNIKK